MRFNDKDALGETKSQSVLKMRFNDKAALGETEASKFFKNGEYQEAIQHYKDSLDVLLKNDMTTNEKNIESAKITSNITLIDLSIYLRNYLQLANAKVYLSNIEEASNVM